MALLVIAVNQASKLVVLADKHNHDDTNPAAIEEIRDQDAFAWDRDWLLNVHNLWRERAQERRDGVRVREREDVFERVGDGEDCGRERVRGSVGGEGARGAARRREVG